MDKNAIKKYAVWARNELIARVTQKAEQYEITEQKTAPADVDSIGGRVLTATEKKQRQALIAKINHDGFEQVMEEVAYTWFNRFTALRFMEVNNYLPSHTRVFTNEAGEFKPQILADAIQLDLEGLDMDKVFELKDANKTEELYKYLLITQCNALSAALPRMFQKIEHYTELLLPDYLLREGSVIERLVRDIPEENFDVLNDHGKVEIIGWLYQYYNSEKKEAVINIKKGAVKKEDIPAATQIFTTDWVVRYIVDNSLGKYWVERYPKSNLERELEYFIKTADIKKTNNEIDPKTLLSFDPCVGSGHFLLYAFDVYMKIYTEYGYSEREAASLIVQNNLFGLDIDERAAQLAYFAVMMKARQYDRRFLGRGIQANVYSIPETSTVYRETVDYYCEGNKELRQAISEIFEDLRNAKECGSLLRVRRQDWNLLSVRFSEISEDISLYRDNALEDLLPIVSVAKILADRYDVVFTNPPYLNKMDATLKEFVNANFKAYATDLFSVFVYRNLEFCKQGGYSGYMTPNVWMFLTSYEDLRQYLIEEKTISSLVQIAKGAFYKDATVDVCTFVVKNEKSNEKGVYIRLEDFKGDMDVQNDYIRRILIDGEYPERVFVKDAHDFLNLPGGQIAYWVGNNIYSIFQNGKKLGDIAKPRQGMATSDNDRFLRLWHEVDFKTVGLGFEDSNRAEESGYIWFPYNKGGAYRKWYGNNEYLVDYEKDGKRVKDYAASLYKSYSRTIKNINFYFKPCITWTMISSSKFGVRYSGPGFVFDIRGSSIFFDDKQKLNYILGFMSSCVTWELLKFLSPTISFEVGTIALLPIIWSDKYESEINNLVAENIEISKDDWDSYETSWDFKRSPLIGEYTKIGDAVEAWKALCGQRLHTMQKNEERINQLFMEIYNLEEELKAEVPEEEVTIAIETDEVIIKRFISYAVGCMFGRYSLSKEGLVNTGGKIDTSMYSGFYPDSDGIIPICDDDYFEDDIVGRFESFIKAVFGNETIEENLQYIAGKLGGKGTSREVIRSYFINGFYSDHLKTYQKRPIYWMFDSGKKQGFKCLVYMHRYKADTIARIRTDYVHEQQSRYRTALVDLEKRVDSANGSERIKLNKNLTSLREQAEEIRVYEEKIHHLADQMIAIDLNLGVKHNYALFEDVLAKI